MHDLPTRGAVLPEACATTHSARDITRCLGGVGAGGAPLHCGHQDGFRTHAGCGVVRRRRGARGASACALRRGR